MREKIEKVLTKIRPFLKEDEGDVEFVRYEKETGVAEIRLLGSCSTCPLSIMTLRAGIERLILIEIPEIRRIEQVR